MYKLSPSDFAYLYEDCKLCFYLKVKHGIRQPSMPMPGVFSAINSLLQTPLVGKNLQEVSKDLPEGLVEKQEGWVESTPVPGTNVYIKGKYDLLVKRPDGSHILVDLKISKANEEKIDKFKTQLGAYKFALENPKYGKPVNITKLGLLVFYPDMVDFGDDTTSVSFPPKWLEVPIDDAGFLSFAKQVGALLDGPEPPESRECSWCQYRHTGETLAHGG